MPRDLQELQERVLTTLKKTLHTMHNKSFQTTVKNFFMAT